jgi:protoporphyrinogen oxidase
MRFNSLYNVNLGITESIEESLSLTQTIYFPSEDNIFYRVGFPSSLSPKMAPKDCRSLSIDVSYSKDRPIDKKKTKDIVIKDLIQTGLIKNRESIIAEKIFDIKYSYVFYDMKYTSIREKSHDFLRKNDIFSIGRYGSWEYSNMDDALIDGKNAANHILDLSRRR